jgi:hypothetical protein
MAGVYIPTEKIIEILKIAPERLVKIEQYFDAIFDEK